MRRRSKTSSRRRTVIKASALLGFGVLGYFVGGYNYGGSAESDDGSGSGKRAQINHYHAFEKDVKPIMEKYCYECHMDGSDKGELDLDRYTSFASMTKDRETWGKIRSHLDLKLMPPVDEDQPRADEVAKITKWIDHSIFYTDPDNPDPGKVTLRRLNRYEYQNTIYDLLGVKIDVDSLLPLDDTGYGFDTIGEVHTVSPAHIEKYLNAAEVVLNKATHIGKMPWAEKVIPLARLKHDRDVNREGRYIVSGDASFDPKIARDGIYVLSIEATSSAAGNEEAILEILRDQTSLRKVAVPANEANPTISMEVSLQKNQKISLGFLNDFYDAKNPDASRRDRNLYIHSVKIAGPVKSKRPPKPATHLALLPKRTMSQTPEMYAREVWKNFATKAFRRSVSLAEIEKYAPFLQGMEDSEESLERHILLGMQAMLCSPSFLYIASDPEYENRPVAPISELALASRLSYFLWSSAPDAALLEKAERNELRSNLAAEIDRMLDDPKATRFVQNFGGQWLQIRDLEVHTPDSKLFPGWNASLRADAVGETEHFLGNLLKENQSVLLCLDADYTFLNENLAKFYGIKGVKGKHFRKVKLNEAMRKQRGGLLGQLSILTLTSYPDRTSPVLRGKWILENILGTPPPPPPPDIPELQPDERKQKHASLRQQLELHRSKAECAACHNLMDPLGFALENYNGIGKWRLSEKGKSIDTSGKLISGEIINSGADLKQVLKNNKSEEFVHCLTEKLLTYSIGRGVEYYDKPAIEKIVAASKKSNYAFRSLIQAICESTPFQKTRTKVYKER